jgi:glycine cleavage system regulatory protein
MKTATIAQLKQELQTLPVEQVLELCMRLAKSKKENKELLAFLLFDAYDLPGYISEIKTEMDAAFENVNRLSLYFAKKTLRKILKDTNKYIKHASSPTVELELLIHFCILLKDTGLLQYKATAISNLYQQQLKKIDKAMNSLHEDLQYEYRKTVETLSIKSLYI